MCMYCNMHIIMACTLAGSTLLGSPIEVGAPAPSVIVLDDSGRSVDLSKELSEGKALVFFYPKAMTPGCTKQACSLRDGWKTLGDRGVKVFGVSGDSVQSQAKFREKHGLPFPLLADKEQKVSDAFGKGRWSRHAYLFIDGELVWRDLSAATTDQADEVLAVMDELGF